MMQILDKYYFFLLVMKNSQILKPLHTSIPFFRSFTVIEIQQISQLGNIFVFNRGTILAKTNEAIDYLGVILEGKVLQAGQLHEKGYLIGITAISGLHEVHNCNIVGDSDGIIFAIRLQTIYKAIKDQTRNKIANYATKKSLQILKMNTLNLKIVEKEQQQADQRLLNKFVNNQLKEFIFKILDVKQRQKFITFFTASKYTCNQKVISKESPVYLLAVLKGQIIVKDQFKKSQKPNIIQAGALYNSQGFLMDHTTFTNLYCFSQEAACLVLYKHELINIMTPNSLHKLYQCLLQRQIVNHQYDIPGQKQKNQIQWEPFLKNTHKIVQLKKKSNVNQPNDTKVKQKTNISKFQSLYQQMLGNKPKTEASRNYQNLLSLNTENDQVKIQGQEKIAMLEKQLQLAHQKYDKINKLSKNLKLSLIEAETRIKLVEVFKQINTIKKVQKTIEGQSQIGTSTLKQVFDEHLKKNKLKILVSKCAYKWLQKTRQSKTSQKQ